MTIENTSKRDPEEHIIGMLAKGDSKYITDMEKEGQTQLVNSTLLPIECMDGDEVLEALGFRFGNKVDDLFREAVLPEGWRKAGSDHDMWSYIQDETGTDRVAVFYKAAFYDRKAHMRLE